MQWLLLFRNIKHLSSVFNTLYFLAFIFMCMMLFSTCTYVCLLPNMCLECPVSGLLLRIVWMCSLYFVLNVRPALPIQLLSSPNSLTAKFHCCCACWLYCLFYAAICVLLCFVSYIICLCFNF